MLRLEQLETIVMVKGTRQAVDVIDATDLCQGDEERRRGVLRSEVQYQDVGLHRYPGRLEQSSDEHVDIAQLRAHGATKTVTGFQISSLSLRSLRCTGTSWDLERPTFLHTSRWASVHPARSCGT